MVDQTSRPSPPLAQPITRRAVVSGLAGTALLDAAAAPAGCKPDQGDDAELLALCEQVFRIEAGDGASRTVWDRVVGRLAVLPAQTWTGLQAKACLLRHLSPLPESDETSRVGSPEDQLLASFIRDVLSVCAQ